LLSTAKIPAKLNVEYGSAFINANGISKIDLTLTKLRIDTFRRNFEELSDLNAPKAKLNLSERAG